MIEVGRGVKDLVLVKAKRGGLRKQETNREKKKSDEDERSQDTATSGRGVEEDHMFTLCLHRIQKQEEGGKREEKKGWRKWGRKSRRRVR